jgi:hypothetical protein
LSDKVQIVQLAGGSSGNFEGSEATVSGWGKSADTETAISTLLRFTSESIISKLKCNLKFFGRIKDSHICLNGAAGKVRNIETVFQNCHF